MRTDSLQQFVKLRRQLTEEKTSIENRLRQINEALGDLQASSSPSSSAPAAPMAARGGRGGKRTMSPEARARIAAAQRARWAAARGERPAAAPAASAGGRPKRRMSAAARKAIAEAARRRWAAAKAAGRSAL